MVGVRLGRDTITFHTSASFHLSSLAWDPITQHFVARSAVSPTVHAILDAGVVEHLISDPSAAGAHGSASSVAVDHLWRRLVVGFSNRGLVAAYDLKSYARVFAVPLPELNTAPGGVAVDLKGGEVFVTSSKRGVVWRVGLDGDVKVVSESKSFGDRGLGGAVHVSRGYMELLELNRPELEQNRTSRAVSPIACGPDASHMVREQEEPTLNRQI